MMIKTKMIHMGLVGAVACGVLCAESTTNQSLNCAVRFETQELRETPVIDANNRWELFYTAYDTADAKPALPSNVLFGRQFKIVSFRWLNPTEI